MRAALITLLLVGVFAPYLGHAQTLPSEALNVLITPSYPTPYSTITISPRSSLVDLARSSVTITVNGEEVESGSGALNALATVGGAGDITTVVVTATVDGQTYRKQLSIRPAEASLIVEPVSTTHPFYPGAGLVASEGLIRFVAMPDLRTSPSSPIPAQNLVYTWRVNNAILDNASGIGKSTLVATAPVRYRNATVSVTVSTQDQSVVAEQEVTVSPVDPIVRIYRVDPLLGPLFSTALQRTFRLFNEEDGFRAVPYFFAQSPVITWSVNGAASETDDDVTVRSTGGRGTAQLEANAREAATAQTAQASLTIRFGEDGILDFFGL